MAQTATAIPVPVEQGCCFETVESIAKSQQKSRPRQWCNTCGVIIGKHMTRVQALEAFTTHALAYPSTHANFGIPPVEGTNIPVSYGEQHGLQAPIPAPVQQSHPSPIAAETASVDTSPAIAPIQSVKPHVLTPTTITPESPTLMDQPSPSLRISTTKTGTTTNNGSAAPTSDQYKILTDMVKINPQLMWSDEQEAHRFLTGLESLLEFSPVKPTHWISLILMMIPGKYELERAWIYNNIMTPLLPWQAAKAAFVKHFQRGDYVDGRRLLYSQCNQVSGETTQEYSRRFQTLASQLHYPDSDIQTIYHYLEGLHRHIQQKLITYKITMRTVGGDPTWDFVSLGTTIALAITIGTEPIYTQHPQIQPTLPLHLQHSALANPSKHASSTNTQKLKSTDTVSSHKGPAENRKRSSNSLVEEKKCQYHPNSTSHTTEECRTQGGKPRDTSVTMVTLKPGLSTPVKPQPTMVTTTTSVKPTTSSGPQCYRCNQVGHMSRECPQNPNRQRSSTPKPVIKPNYNNNGNPIPSRAGQPAAPPTKRARRAHVTFNVNPTTSSPESDSASPSMDTTQPKSE